MVEEQIGGNLHEDIADEENGQGSLILAADKVKILFETLQTGSGVVVAVMTSAKMLDWQCISWRMKH